MPLSITPKSLAKEISHANQRVYYSGAGIDTEVSDILIRSKQLNPSLEVIVVIDCTAHARRLGYGTQTSIQQLQQHKIQVFQQQGDSFEMVGYYHLTQIGILKTASSLMY
jgi:hypothetical protein